MSIDQLASIEKIQRMKARGQYIDPLPQWVYERSGYPDHPRQNKLIDVFRKAFLERDRRTNVIQFAVKRRLQEGYQETPETVKSLEDCKRQEKEAQEVLHQAARELEAFINHTPQQRISLYESEMAQLEIQLMEAHARERVYTEELLADPDAARRRLDRMVQGRSGEKAEFDAEQLNRLRQLRSQVETIKSKIWSCQRDVQSIRDRVAKEEQKAQIKTKMEEVLPQFQEACVEFEKALQYLKDIASECDLQLFVGNLKVPKSATFKEPAYSYDKPSIQIEF